MACRWWSARPPTAASHSTCQRARTLILQDPRNGAQLAQALERLGSEPELRASLAERGLAIAREQSWEAVAARYESLYAQVLREREQAAA